MTKLNLSAVINDFSEASNLRKRRKKTYGMLLATWIFFPVPENQQLDLSLNFPRFNYEKDRS